MNAVIKNNDCNIKDVKSRMKLNFLNLNDKITEFLFGNPKFLDGFDHALVSLVSYSHPSVKNLGVTALSNLTNR